MVRASTSLSQRSLVAGSQTKPPVPERSRREGKKKQNKEVSVMPYIYILECCDGSYYTGSTNDLERRLVEHQNGIGAKHTAKRLPVRLVFCEEFERVDEAFYREKQVQGWSRQKKQALIAGNYDALHRLAVCGNETSHQRAGFDCAQPTEASA